MLGIIGAMQVEVDALKGLMTDQQMRTISNMEYVAGKLDGRPVVAVVCGEGKVAAAICAQTLKMCIRDRICFTKVPQQKGQIAVGLGNRKFEKGESQHEKTTCFADGSGYGLCSGRLRHQR